jgi:hypothetical protein
MYSAIHPRQASSHLSLEVRYFLHAGLDGWVYILCLCAVFHALDADYLFGTLPSMNASASALHLAEVIIDYWLSFTVSLDPNDGKGTKRPSSALNFVRTDAHIYIYLARAKLAGVHLSIPSSFIFLKFSAGGLILKQVLMQLNGENTTLIPVSLRTTHSP